LLNGWIRLQWVRAQLVANEAGESILCREGGAATRSSQMILGRIYYYIRVPQSQKKFERTSQNESRSKINDVTQVIVRHQNKLRLQ